MGGGLSGSMLAKRDQKIFSRNQKLKAELQKINALMKSQQITQQLVQDIISLTVQQLVKRLNDGSLTSMKIVIVYCYRAATIGMQLNLMVEDNFAQALQVAEKCDQLRKIQKKKNWTFQDLQKGDNYFPPLFGIPLSVKQTFYMNGFQSAVGCINGLGKTYQDGPVLHCTRNSGIIPFVRTACVQLGMTIQTNSFLWGRSINPWNQSRSVGGSSGGQGGIIACKGSPIGLGSDIGGSLRCPAQFNGVFTFKCNSKRIITQGHNSFCPSFSGMAQIIPLTIGPLATSTNDLALWLKVMSTTQYFKDRVDEYFYGKPFDTKLYLQTQKSKKMRIGYIKKFQFSEPTKTSQRALDEVIIALKDKGFQMVELKLPNEKQLIRSFIQTFYGEGKIKSFKQILGTQPIIPQYRTISIVTNLNMFIFPIVKKLAGLFMPRMKTSLENIEQISSHQLLKMMGQIGTYRRQWIQYLKKNQVSLCLAPGFGCQALKHGLSDDIGVAGAVYTYVWNVLDVPVGSLPITVVKQGQQIYETTYKDIISAGLKKNCIGSIGLPAGIQVVGKPYQQQKVLGLMKIIEDDVKFYKNHPLPTK